MKYAEGSFLRPGHETHALINEQNEMNIRQRAQGKGEYATSVNLVIVRHQDTSAPSAADS